MEISSFWSLAAINTAAILLLSLLVYTKLRKDAATNPGRPWNLRSCKILPRGSLGIWPFIGETLHFIASAYSDRPEAFMDKRRRLYGNVFRSHLFGNPTIVSTDAEVSRMILQSDPNSFVPSYPKSLMELMGKSSILLVNGARQRRIHGLIGGFLRSAGFKVQVTADMEKCVLAAMADWGEDRPVYIQDEARKIAFQVLVKALISLDGGDAKMEVLKKHFQKFIAGLMSLPLKFPGTQLYRSLQAKKKMIEVIDEIIEAKRKRICRMDENNNKNNMYGNGAAKDVAEALMMNEDLTDDAIAENLIDLMIPGEDSVPLLITLSLKYLSESPAALHLLTEENVSMRRVKEKKGEPFSWNDYLSLPFTQNVITETLRMGNIIIGVMRKAMKDVEIRKGNAHYLIPKGWCVLAYFRSVHLDHHLYDFPYHFNPWRWQHQQNNKEMVMSKFTPFGGGQRLCPGHELSRLEASIFLHHFVNRFARWEAEEDSIINFPTVRMKRRLPVWVKKATSDQFNIFKIN
ncbi:3-epi-6-deoxocathasterone 23-monooxygenase CYP90D1 [Andrographis paniculata]|uniref:3-epi-6-deoxocathasterone 23-monooxygenase CYP90D1 n=1 Tax=Andrographis paniculata TaxID=175694 RepID=UPI0021E83AAB|nr:3-epi-6-deoxocathasterone 23-monooxygenase CYP90D1 [Andrographis paniculata]